MSRNPAGGSSDQRRRTLSQNFLVGRTAIDTFIEAADLGPDDLVVEVGAGSGALTPLIADRCRWLVAYELDRNMAKRLDASIGGRNNVETVYGDFLDADPPDEPFALVGNVPFGATSSIVDWALSVPDLLSATLITQLEYAKKRTGAYGRWSRLTVLSWPEYRWDLVGRIPRTDFRPVPRVDAGIIRIERRPEPLLHGPAIEKYWAMVELAFTGVGGSVQASLNRRYPSNQVRDALRDAEVGPRDLVAFVTPEQWLLIFDRLRVAPGRDGRGRALPGRGRG